ncbi:MAG: aspartate aminotransferase family protein [Bacteroidales bacterium]|nr:aspartate aminotransferase family protein [Bacteroidales bacterium]
MAIQLNDFRKHVAQISELDPIIIEPVEAEGVWVTDINGKKYIDMLSGICVGNAGHKNPKVVQAIKDQCDKYLHVMVYGEFIQKPQMDYAVRIKELLPQELTQIFYVNSGSEAIEGAVKAAKLYNKRNKILSYTNSYHGSTIGCVSMLSDTKFRENFLPLLPFTDNIRFNCEEDLMKIDTDTCCVVAESIAVGEGVQLPQDDYLKKLRKRCDETGTVLILDEIQTGFGRTGTLFAFEQFGFVPDILCIAKAMGGGLPIGAFIGKEEIMSKLNNHHPLIGHATTYGGNPVCLAAALAQLNCVADKDLLLAVKQKGEIYRRELKHKHIKQVTGIGLFNAIYLNGGVDWQQVLIKCFENGIITGTHLFNANCISIKPPLTITEDEIMASISRILNALDKI